MIIEFQKRKDGSFVLRCVRDDGTETHYRPKQSHSHFFACHDLTHVAVESVLTQLQGFFSLINSGWEVTDFETAKEHGVAIPDQTGLVELIVGLLDSQRATNSEFNATDMNQYIATHYESSIPAQFQISQVSLDSIIAMRDRLLADWTQLKNGDRMQVEFPVTENRT